MPIELVSQDIFSSLAETPNFVTGSICPGCFISGRPLDPVTACVEQNGPDAPYRLSRMRQGELDMVKVDLNQDYAWFRIEHVLSPEALTTGFYRLQFLYLSDHSGRERLPQAKIIEYTKAGGHTFAKIVAHLGPTATLGSVDVDFALSANAYPDRQYRLCIEIGQTGSFCFGGLSLTRYETDPNLNNQDVAPYRSHSFQVSKDLQELNDNMDFEMRRAPQDWLARMLGVALRLEDYETASGIARYIRKHHGDDRAAMIKAAPRVLDTLLALGDLDEARRFLIDMASMGIAQDQLTQAGRILAGVASTNAGKPPRQPRSHNLPSGRVDVFNLNRDIEHSLVAFEDMLTLPSPAEAAPLLWTNYLRHFGQTDYLERLNAYLGRHDSPFHVELNGTSENILQCVSFRQHRPLLGLLSEGPLVSIIVAAWNASETIGYALRSLLGQSYQNIEILVADDASNDDTAQKLQEFQSDPRVTIFRGTQNQGPYNIRNQLIAKAKGELITFHDADDVALPHRIAAQVTAMAESKAHVSLGSWLRIKPNGHVVAFRDDQFLRRCLNSIMYTRSVFDTFGPYRSVLCGADSEFYEMLRGRLPARDIVSLAQPLVLGLWGSGSLTRTAGIEADEVGYRAPSRRAYAGLVGRQRILGQNIVPDEAIEHATAEAGILRQPADLVPLEN